MFRQKTLVSIALFILPITSLVSKPDLITIPFRTIGKMIVVQGSIDGRVGNIVIDTGIPDMLINQRFFSDLELFSTGASDSFQAINGTGRNAATALVYLKIQDFSVKAGATVMDLQAVERQKRTNILGIVGIDLFRKFELELDYLSQEIRLYRLDKDGQRKLQQPEALPSEVVDLDFYQHLPCITTYLHGTPLQLGLDTGAEKTLFAASIYKKQKEQLQNVRPQRMMDLHGLPVKGIAARINGLEVGGLEISAIPAVFIAMNTHYGSLNEKRIQGLLGYDFLQHFRLAINFKKKKAYLWTQQQNENMPLVIREK